MTEPEARSVARMRLRVAREHLEHVKRAESAAKQQREDAIRHALKAGMKVCEVGETLGLTRQSVYLIAGRR